MTFLMRSTLLPRTHLPGTILSVSSRRYAGTDYGSKQSGHEQGINQANPMKHLEHPGPESPAATKNPAAGSDTSGASESGQKGQGASDAGNSQGKPTIQTPYSAAEDKDPEVRKHNEEMRNRHERSSNQLGEEDNKVDKKFWSGDVGDIEKKNG